MDFSGRSSDISLVELENNTVKEDDRAALLEDGVLQATSPASHSSSITSPVFRLFTMDESFLLENRLALRAISEFGLLLFYFYLCDRTNFLGDSKKLESGTFTTIFKYPAIKQLAIKWGDEYGFVIRPCLVGVTFESVRIDL
ncbi:hypothetical protein Tco_1426190 [Tanacetum coccineum]